MSVTTQEQQNGLLNFIERAARDPEFDIGKFGELLRMQREVVAEQERREFNRAMAAAQTEMQPVVRDAQNTHTNSKYAKLETIDREMRPIYTRHGFSVRFGSAISPNEGWLRIVCTVSHTGGYSETNYLDAPPDRSGSGGRTNKTEVQAVGSSVTYLRRYLLAMVFNIVLADDDDDGEGTRRQAKPPHRPVNGAGKPVHPLDEPNGTQWVKNLAVALRDAQSLQDVDAIEADPRVVDVYEHKATQSLKEYIDDRFREARERLRAMDSKANGRPPEDWVDPIAGLLDEVEAMDLIAIGGLPTNAEWRAKTRDLFPPDADRLGEAIEAHKAALQQEKRI